MKDINDDILINKIGESLWQFGDNGKASIMVGAGFSKNAKCKITGQKSFPLWNELAEEMFFELYPSKIGDLKFKYTKTLGKNVLTLAQEYEATFGAVSLNQFIVNKIPDSLFEPGILHQKLLELPWVDVFTTNYDTLLERQAEKIININYDIVRTIKEIPLKAQPRIVKLHGSLPSNSPYIITEEDYRKYPIRYSPFVNLVQESMIENTFCLIGFSGSDPNFLAWKGWVRDNLGDNSPPIYLIGLFDHSESERFYFEKSFIKLINLASFIKDEQFYRTSMDRHTDAYNTFFDFLKKKKPIDKRKWPFE